jgi:predicted DNA-binding protein YlxM (UPF0122 family)
MKSEQQQQVRRLFIQSDLNKTEIADTLTVDRRTIYQWSIDGDWEKLKTSAKCMPSMLAEKCYYLLGNLTDSLLSKDIQHQAVQKSDVDMIYKLAKTINILKKGSTINENMETFTWFLEGLHKRDAGLAEALIPHADAFITARAGSDAQFTAAAAGNQSHHEKSGHPSFPEKEIIEKWRDEEDAAAIAKEMQEAAAKASPAYVTPPSPSERAGVRPTAHGQVTPPSPSERAGVRPPAQGPVIPPSGTTGDASLSAAA